GVDPGRASLRARPDRPRRALPPRGVGAARPDGRRPGAGPAATGTEPGRGLRLMGPDDPVDADERAPYDPMPHGPAEVGLGPWEGPWPAGDQYDERLLAEGDTPHAAGPARSSTR